MSTERDAEQVAVVTDAAWEAGAARRLQHLHQAAASAGLVGANDPDVMFPWVYDPPLRVAERAEEAPCRGCATVSTATGMPHLYHGTAVAAGTDAGEWWLCDRVNTVVHHIRGLRPEGKVAQDPAGAATVTTYGRREAGGGIDEWDGPAGVAQFCGPAGVAVCRGRAYVCDGSAVRVLDPATRAVSTLAGPLGRDLIGYDDAEGAGPDAFLWRPSAITADEEAGVLYVATGANRIVRISVETAAVTFFAGRGTTIFDLSPEPVDGSVVAAQFHGIVAMAFDGWTDTLWVLEGGTSRRLRAVNLAGYIPVLPVVGTVTTVPGINLEAEATPGVRKLPRLAPFFEPAALTLDGDGGLYVADLGSDTVWEVDLQACPAVIATAAGQPGGDGSSDGAATTVAKLRMPTALALHPRTGELLVLESELNRRAPARIRVVTGLAAPRWRLSGLQSRLPRRYWSPETHRWSEPAQRACVMAVLLVASRTAALELKRVPLGKPGAKLAGGVAAPPHHLSAELWIHVLTFIRRADLGSSHAGSR